MAMFDSIGDFMFPNDGNLSDKEEQREEKRHQEQSLEMMYMYQLYYGAIEENKYALRGSVLSCQYGTKYAKLDCLKDHGVYKGKNPVLAITDCAESNIHNFGSCLCPESNYAGRLPMTVGQDSNGVAAIKVPQNTYAHICVPVIGKSSVWHQAGSDVLIDANQKGYVPMLLDDAVLICQYGGIIRIVEVPNTSGDGGLGGMVLSRPNGLELLKELELKEYQLLDIEKRDSGGNLIGMMPYYVMKNGSISGKFVDDGGITIGYGHHINAVEWKNPDDPDHKLLAPYVPSNVVITGITANRTTLPISGLIVVPSSTMVPISIINSQYEADVKLHSKAISDWLDKENIKVTQKEFDALVICRYNRGNLPENAMKYLIDGNRNKADWERIWTGGQNRKDKCQSLFFGGEY
jgi:hypothetical protein